MCILIIDLAKICELKGLSRSEIKNVIQTYNKMVPKKQQQQPIVKVQSSDNNLFNKFAKFLGN